MRGSVPNAYVDQALLGHLVHLYIAAKPIMNILSTNSVPYHVATPASTVKLTSKGTWDAGAAVTLEVPHPILQSTYCLYLHNQPSQLRFVAGSFA